MPDETQRDRIARLRAELDALPFVEREAALAALPREDRDALVDAGLEEIDGALPKDSAEDMERARIRGLTDAGRAAYDALPSAQDDLEAVDDEELGGEG